MSGAANTTGFGNICLGYSAGRYNTTLNNRIYLNSIDRGTAALDSTAAILYGYQHATPASQVLTVNGKLKINDGSQAAGSVLTSDANGLGTWSASIALSGSVSAVNLLSGTYTPTLTNTTNVSASTAYVTGYYRVGNSVTVYGRVDIDATLAAPTELQMTLPVASNLAAEQDLGGTAASDVAAGLSARVKGDATTDRASIAFTAVSLTADHYSFNFSYQIK